MANTQHGARDIGDSGSGEDCAMKSREIIEVQWRGVWRAFEITLSKKRSADVVATEAAGMKRIKNLRTREFQKFLECETLDSWALNNLESQEHRI